MEPLRLIRINSKGPLVSNWELFLTGQGLFEGVIDGIFDEAVKDATIQFQRNHGLQPDGIVGNKTFGQAMILGFEGATDTRTDKSGPAFPAKPNFRALGGNAARQEIFGKFKFIAAPVPGNPENIRILDNWESKNIVTVSVPQLKPINGTGKVRFHKLAAAQMVKLWADWDNAGLMPLVLTWAGSFVPRFIRGSREILSNHSFGSAFDINVAWNGLGSMPALVGQKGSVRELVPIANENGFYWGGHFNGRPDGMHFEIAKIL